MTSQPRCPLESSTLSAPHFEGVTADIQTFVPGLPASANEGSKENISLPTRVDTPHMHDVPEASETMSLACEAP